MEIDENSIEIIKFKINEIKVNSEIESIKLKLKFKNVNPNDIDRKNAIELRGIWKDISKLSLGGYKEFPFFRQLFVRDVHQSPIYNTAMYNIGYKQVGRQWKLIRRPTLDVVVDYIYRYCLYSYIVESKKEIKGIVSSFRSDVIITEESSNSVQIKDSGACQIRNEVPNSKNHNWKCFFCDNENDDELMKCLVCDCAKDEMSNGISDKPGGMTGISPCRPKSNVAVVEVAVSSPIDESNSSDISMDLCPRCKRRSANKDKSMICRLCADELYMKEMKELDVLNIFGDKSPTKSDNDGPGEDKWRCTACSMINSLDVDKCGACGVEGPHFNKWICDHCKERNSYDVDKCGDCGGHGPHYDKWRCDQCTKINDKLARHCDVCDAENNGIMKCPQCHVTDINSKCDTRCRECIRGLSGGKRRGEGNVRQIVVDRRDGSDIPREDGWSCGKCARHNPYDLVICGGCGTMGPHYDKWRCDKCTCLNERWTSMCSACHEYQQHRHIYTLATIGGGESVRDVCRGKCAERGDTLCYLCIGRYYKCGNTKCKKFNSNDDKFCRHCGVKQYSLLYNGNLVECRIDGGIRKMWQCTFTKCMHLNSEYTQVCIKCDCPRYAL